MSIALISEKNILQKKIFLPELDSTVLLVAVPKDYKLADVCKSKTQFIYTSINSSHNLLQNYDIFLVSDSSIFDSRILSTLYEVLKYKNSCFIDDFLLHLHTKNVSDCSLITVQTSQRLHFQGFLESSRKLICKEVLIHHLLKNLFFNACAALWSYHRNCVTDMFMTLKSDGNSTLNHTYGGYCICSIEDISSNLELQKFIISLVFQTRHIQSYYSYQIRLFQLLSHRRRNFDLETNKDYDPVAIYDSLLSDTNIYRNLDFWKTLWNYHQTFYNTIPCTKRSFPKHTSSAKCEKQTTDFIMATVSKIRRKLKGTLYDSKMSEDGNSVQKKGVKRSNSTTDDDTSQYKSMEVHKDLKKYWVKRYRLFSKFDEGIKLDYESWFSVTPEKIAIHIAEKCKGDIVIDAFCGAGGNSIQFANTCQHVMSIDIDLQKLKMARHNAKIYGVDNKIDFILGNFFCLADRLVGDVVFLSPPWGGPKYVKKNVFDLKNIMEPYGGEKLLKTAQKISRNIAYYLPKNIDTSQLLRAAGKETKVEVEKNFLNDQVVAVTAYYGDLIGKTA